jgi:hypothetical protein
LLSVDWIQIIDPAWDVNGYVEKFYEIVNNKLDEFCPMITKYENEKEPRWISRNSKRLKRKQRKAHSKWKKSKSDPDHKSYKATSMHLKDSLHSDHDLHLENVEKDLRANPKKFWKYIGEKKSNGIGVADFLRLENEIAESKEEAVSLFSKHFSSTLNTRAHDVDDITSSSHNIDQWNEHRFNMNEIYEKLFNIKLKLSPGPDKLPSNLFKFCASSLTFPLYVIFNKSLKSGVFPSVWKNVFVSPVHKKGSMNEIKNYRPVSKASIIAKIFDALIADEISTRFSHVIPEEQHGFVKKRSTITNLIKHTERLQKSAGSRGQTDVVYFDFSSAFDKVPHNRLLAKLNSLGISGRILEWLKSFLSDRTQQVKIDDVLSERTPVTSSVIQGSHIGPVLFCLYISDLTEVLDVDFSLYADDIKICSEIHSADECQKLQTNIDRLIRYAEINGLSLNISKCNVVSYTLKTSSAITYAYKINEELIQRDVEFRDLGVIFDKKLNFNKHIDTVCSKARQMYGFIMRNSKEFKSPSTSVNLFKSLSRSVLEYASVIWSPYHSTRISQIETVQHVFLRAMARRHFGDFNHEIDYAFYENELKLQPLELRRVINDVKFVANSFNGKVESQTFRREFKFHIRLPRETRQNPIFSPNASQNEIASNSVFNRLMKNFNKYVGDHDFIPEGRSVNNSLISSITEKFKDNEDVN